MSALSAQDSAAVTLRLSVVVPTHRRPNSIQRLLESLAVQTLDRRQFEVLIVSNFPDAKLNRVLAPWLAQSAIDIKLLITNLPGVNRARNKGLIHSQGTFALLLDDDCYLEDANYLRRLIELHDSHATTFALGGIYLSPAGLGSAAVYYNEICNAWLEAETEFAKNTTKLLGGAVSYKLSLLKEKRLYFQDSILYGGAETELHERVVAAGLEMVLHPDLAVAHAGQVTVPNLVFKAYRQGFGKVANNLRSSKSVERRAGDKRPQRFYDFIYKLAFAHGERRARNLRPPQSRFAIPFVVLGLAGIEVGTRALRKSQSWVTRFYWATYPTIGQIRLQGIRAYWAGRTFASSVRLKFVLLYWSAVKWYGFARGAAMRVYWTGRARCGQLYWSTHRKVSALRAYLRAHYWSLYRQFFETKGRIQSSVIRYYWTIYPVTYFFKRRGWRRPKDLLRIRMPLTHPNLETVGAPLWIAMDLGPAQSDIQLRQTQRLRQLGIKTLCPVAWNLPDAVLVADGPESKIISVRISEINTESTQILAALAKHERPYAVLIHLDQPPDIPTMRRFFGQASAQPRLEALALEAPARLNLPSGTEFEVFRWAHKLALAGEGLRLNWRAIYRFDESVDTLTEHQPARFSTRYESSKSAPEVSLIIPHHRDFCHLRAVLRCIQAQDLGAENFEVLVIDNGVETALLREPECAELVTEFADLRLALFSMRSADEKLFLSGHARNVGLTHAQGRVIQFLDSDILLPARFLTELVETMNHADVVIAKRSMLKHGHVPPPDALASLPKQCFYRENDYWEGFKAARQWTDLQDFWKYACTYCLAVKRSHLLQSGPFDPSFTMYGFEDVDLAFRLYKIGARFQFAASNVFHLYPSRDAHNYHIDEQRRAEALRRSSLNFFLKRPERAPFALCQGYFAPTLAEWLKRPISTALTARPHDVQT